MKPTLSVLLLILATVASCTAGYAGELPNFVFIMTDD